MKKDKIVFIKEKEIAKKADENADEFLNNQFTQNPIEAKFLAFQKTKKEIKIQDLF